MTDVQARDTTIRQGEAALDSLARRFAGLLRGTRDGGAAVTGMRWTVAEIAAHVVQTATDATTVASGGESAYAAAGFSREVDERMVRDLPERDCERLAALVDERYAALIEALRAHHDDERMRIGTELSVAAVRAIASLDFMVHGHQVATATGQAWSIDAPLMRDCAAIVVPFLVDTEAARGFTGTYSVRFGHAAPLVYGFDAGRMHMDQDRRPDCMLRADPLSFLLMGIGAVPQWRLALTGRLRAGGRRPWLALRLQRLLPAVPHGGVAR